jgi:propionaldehyde dehydrogenase
MSNPAIKLLVVTGGQSLTKAALTSGKKTICAGAGNPPVIVDETANIENAAQSIITGSSFDHNVNCIGEKGIIVVESIYDKLLFNLQQNGAYLVKKDEMKKLEFLVLEKSEIEAENYYRTDFTAITQVNKSLIGQSATSILKRIGIEGSSAKIIVADTDLNHPFATNELLMPVLPIIKVKNIDEAIEASVVLEKGNRHTAIIHQKTNRRKPLLSSMGRNSVLFKINKDCIGRFLLVLIYLK